MMKDFAMETPRSDRKEAKSIKVRELPPMMNKDL
jgi:hypothetical protein